MDDKCLKVKVFISISILKSKQLSEKNKWFLSTFRFLTSESMTGTSLHGELDSVHWSGHQSGEQEQERTRSDCRSDLESLL